MANGTRNHGQVQSDYSINDRGEPVYHKLCSGDVAEKGIVVAQGGRLFLRSKYECHRRSCPVCEGRNAGRRRKSAYSHVVAKCVEEGGLWLTLTVSLPGRDYSSKYLTRCLAVLRRGLASLRGSEALGGRLRTGVTTFEVTSGKKERGWHVHCHGIWVGGGPVALPDVRRALEAAGLGHVFHVRYLRRGLDIERTVSYLAGYSTKTATAVGGLDKQLVTAYDEALRRRRLLQIWR